MIYKPHDYQNTMIRWIIEHKNCAIFAGMGLGKTVTVLKAAQILVDLGLIKRILVVAPLKPARDTWPQEVAKWDFCSTLPAKLFWSAGNKSEKKHNRVSMITIVSASSIIAFGRMHQREKFANWNYDMMVIDESSKLKNKSSQMFKAIDNLANRVSRIAIMTGTPIGNTVANLWAQMFILDRGARLGRNLKAFRAQYQSEISLGANNKYYVDLVGAEQEIGRRISDIALSLQEKDYLNLPPLFKHDIKVSMNKKEKLKYVELVENFVLETAEGDITAVNGGVLSNKLLQFASGCVYLDDSKEFIEIHTRKLEALKLIYESLEDENCIVCYNYKFEREQILREFPEAVIYDGLEVKSRWDKGQIKMLVTHPASCAYGVNLQQGGNVLIWFSPTWSHELTAQMNKRLHRQGVTRPVAIYRILMEDTIDEKATKKAEKHEITEAAFFDEVKQHALSLLK